MGIVLLVASACSDDDAETSATPGLSVVGVASTSTSSPVSTTVVTPSSSPTSPPLPTSTATTAQRPPAVTAEPVDTISLGESIEGRPITAVRRGRPGGTTVLVVGVIHGDEAAGAAIVDVLRDAAIPAGIDLWLVPSANPDGQAAGTRHNANGVDLNRNFPTNWGPVAQPGDWQYAGPGPASEPEIQAMLALSEQVQPDLTLWYHQDLFRINPAPGRDGEIRQRYADLTGLPIIEVTGGTYTGTASQWSRTIAAAGGIGFTVELGETLSADGARRHAAAVLAVATEL